MRWYWIDRFTEFKRATRAVALKAVSMAEEQNDGYYPGVAAMPSSLIIEGMAQTAGLLVGEMSGFTARVVLAKIGKAVFHQPALAGDVLRYTAELESVQSHGATAKVTSHRVGLDGACDSLQAEVELMFAFLVDDRERFPAGPLFDPSEFLLMLRAMGLYDVAVDESGAPLPQPQLYLDAEAERYAPVVRA